MTDKAKRALLPAGLMDVLPPEAAFEAGITESLIAHFACFGYERVKPPLIEFEESLITGSGVATASQTFRIMDPVSQRMLGVRPDMTIQIARIAATRLAEAPRPLRLSYAGQVLRVLGSDLRPERQFGQVGAELIGAAAPAADAEVVQMTAEALTTLGVDELSVDLGLPTLVPLILADLGIDASARDEKLWTALNQKDAAAIAELGGDAARVLGALLDAAGSADRAMAALGALSLGAEAAREVAGLAEVIGVLRRDAPDMKITVDPVERRGFEYHTGMTFTFFAAGVRGELGQGGRYLAGLNGDNGGAEPATGITLYLDSVLRAVAGPEPARRLYLPFGTTRAAARACRDEGWDAVAGLEAEADASAEARRLGCTHILVDGKAVALTDGEGSD